MMFVYEGTDKKERLDRYLANRLPGETRSRIKGLISGGNISVNGKSSKPAAILKKGDIVEVSVPETVDSDIAPEDIELDIVYEDGDIIVINKEKGMVVHPAIGHSSGTLVNALMYHCRDSLSGIGGTNRPGIVHRIDKDTTGLLVACKNDFAHRVLSDELRRHEIVRTYYALCWGNIKKASGVVDRPIERSRKNHRLYSAESGEGREAVTHFRVLERLKLGTECLTFLELVLETGRTHQIRVHMSYMKHPLLGDREYGRKNDPFQKFGQFLHAGSLVLKHPVSGELMTFEAPLPVYFSETLGKLRK